MRNVLIPIGVLVFLVGLVFALQGFGVIGGSAMSGKTTWAIIGPLVALAGLGLVGVGLRRRG